MGGTESRRWDDVRRDARLSGLYAGVCGAMDWIAAVALRALGAGQSGDGNLGQWQSWAMEWVPVANSDEQLLSVLATLEECRTALRQSGKNDTAQLVAVAILDLRMKFSHIGDAELKALCEEMLLSEASDARSQRRRPLLRLIK